MYLYECINRVMRVIDQNVYYFNSEGIYSQTTVREAKTKKLDGLLFSQAKGEYYEDSFLFPTKGSNRAIACLELGDNIDKFEKYIYKFDRLYQTKREKPFINNVIRISEGKFYFFNEQGVYTCLKEKEILPTDICINVVTNPPGRKTSYYYFHAVEKLAKVYDVCNMGFFMNVISHLKPGDTFFTLEDYCYNKKREFTPHIWEIMCR